MKRGLDYGAIAAEYDRRYEWNDYSGVARAVSSFVDAATSTPGTPARMLEVGCGTGHWLQVLAGRGHVTAGVDPSPAMLARARVRLGGATASLIRGVAEKLPVAAESQDLILCINSFHHFDDRVAFIREAYRALRGGGGLMTIGLDPHTGLDQWWIYDTFPQVIEADRARYRPTGEVRAMMTGAGLVRCGTREIQHLPFRCDARTALERGLLDKSTTSQLAILSDDEYTDGIARLRARIGVAEARGEKVDITADLRLYSTEGWKTPAESDR